MKYPITLTAGIVRKWFHPRKPESHKGDYGHVLVIAGSKGLTGASVLSSLGALRGGTGLVTVALPKSREPIAARNLRPEAMTLPVPETPQGTISAKAAAPILDFIKRRKITSLAIGPGLSRNRDTAGFVRKLLSALDRNCFLLKGIVLDADGFLALKDGGMLKKIHLPLIVTPHIGEMAGFCGVTPASIRKSAIEFDIKFAKLYNVISILKSHKTVISDGNGVYLNTTGNPGMATGGSGDVLTGLIAALIAQIPKGIFQAAAAGVFIHGLAGDLAKGKKTEISLIAGDIADNIPEALKKLSIL